MDPYIQLIIHNIASIISAITALGVAFFLFLNGQHKTANITFACTFFLAAIFTISHVVGVNVSDPELSRSILMWNLVVFFIAAVNLHAVYAVIGKEHENRYVIRGVYAVATFFVAFFLIFPELFLLPSVPKMYFPNYYNPTVLNWIRVAFLHVIIVPFAIIELYGAYVKAVSDIEKKRLKYFILTMVIGYGVAFIPNLLVYNIPADPLLGMAFAAICAIPLVYGAVKYELFNVQVIAKQAFFYSIAVGVVGGIIILLNYLDTLIVTTYPEFPTWTLAFVSAILVVSVSIIVWKSLRESDLMKAEFITTVTHKFRTPLTYIKWASDNLVNPNLSLEDRKSQVEYIRAANEKLVELTNILTSASEADNKEYMYSWKKLDISKTVEEVIGSLESQFKIKNFKIVKELESDLFAKYDDARLKFVIQVLLENALHYSKDGGTVTVSTHGTHKDVTCTVKDTGIGMSPTQVSLLFSKFFRSDAARKLDTEGMGIGLYITQKIVEKHGGKIWAESAGEGKGSTFHFSLPRIR